MRFGRFAAVACILLMLFSSVALADNEYPRLSKVFGQERSEGEDVIYLRSNEALKGEILNKELSLYTPYAFVKLPIDKCAGVSFEASVANTEIVTTVNYNRLSGVLVDRFILLKDSEGNEQKIRKESIRHILFRQDPEKEKFIDPGAETDLFVMANGDLLTGKSEPADIAEKIAAGGIEVFALKLDIGVEVDNVYKSELKKSYAGDGNMKAVEKFPASVAVMNLGPSITRPSEDVWEEVPQKLVIASEDYSKRRLGPVAFSHMKHNMEYGVTCAECHHWQDEDPAYQCSACHDPDQKQGKVLKLKNAFHADCKGCHKEVAEAGRYPNAPYQKCNYCHEDSK